jgi:hypothetical protein
VEKVDFAGELLTQPSVQLVSLCRGLDCVLTALYGGAGVWEEQATGPPSCPSEGTMGARSSDGPRVTYLQGRSSSLPKKVGCAFFWRGLAGRGASPDRAQWSSWAGAVAAQGTAGGQVCRQGEASSPSSSSTGEPWTGKEAAVRSDGFCEHETHPYPPALWGSYSP